MQNHKKLSSGVFEILDEDQKEFVMECVACFHYRNGKSNLDGSMGEINISPGELTNLLAYVLKYNK